MRDFVTWLTWLTWIVGLVGAAALLAFAPPAVPDTRAFTQSTALKLELNEESYQEVLPGAETFESRDAGYKHIRGYSPNASGDQELVGFVFLTKDLGATNRGYIGLIPILVGMDLRGHVTGVKILKHFEPYLSLIHI